MFGTSVGHLQGGKPHLDANPGGTKGHTKQGYLLLATAMFMASVGHHQVGSPPLGPQTQVAKQLNTTPSKQQDLLLGTQLAADSKPQVALPLLGKQACLRGSNRLQLC